MGDSFIKTKSFSDYNYCINNDEMIEERKVSNEEEVLNDSSIQFKSKTKSELNLTKVDKIDDLTFNQKLLLVCSVNVYKSFKNIKLGLEKLDNHFNKSNIQEFSDNSSFISNKSTGSETKGFNEFLRPEIFDEMYESILKYIIKFYSRLLRSSIFKEKLQEIFLYYWKKRNNFVLEDLLTIELPKNSQVISEFYNSRSQKNFNTNESMNIKKINTSRTESKNNIDNFIKNIENDNQNNLGKPNKFKPSKN